MIIVVIMAIAQTAYAINLGSLQKTESLSIHAGETGAAVILLWTQEDRFPVQMEVTQAPENWNVSVAPKEFELSRSPSGPIEYIMVRGERLKAQAVKVLIHVPKSEEQKRYEVTVTLVGGSGEHQVAVVQERAFRFSVDVLGKALPGSRTVTETTITETARTDSPAGITGMAPAFSPESNPYVLFIVLLVILVALWVYYKHV